MISDTQVGTSGWLFPSLIISLFVPFNLSSLVLFSAASLICLTHSPHFSLSPFYASFFFVLTCFEPFRFLSSYRRTFLVLFDPKKLLPAFASPAQPIFMSPVRLPPHVFMSHLQSYRWNRSWPIRFWREAEWGFGCRLKRFLPKSPTNSLPTTRNCLELM